MSLPRAARNALAAIETLSQLDGRTPTADERQTLSNWTGWGPLAKALAPTTDEEWAEVGDRIEQLLDPKAFTAAQDVCDTSFYTPGIVTDAVFDLLRHSGFTGGRVLEPGCGIGHFLQATPDDLDISWTGIDADPTAAKIASTLAPDAEIISARLERHHFPSGSFDAVVGNVPFSGVSVHDPSFPSPNLHTYFVQRAIDAVRPGGFIVLVISRHFTDSLYSTDTVIANADLMAAVRLPSGVFEGTEVVSDIVVLRRKDGIRKPKWTPEWATVEHRTYDRWGSRTEQVTVQQVVDLDEHASYSTLWNGHEDCIAGTMEATGYAPFPLRVRSGDREADIRRAVLAACQSFDTEDQERQPTFDISDVALFDAEGRKEGSFHLIDAVMHQVSGGKLVPVARAPKELTALVRLRDAAMTLIGLESDPDLADDEIAPARAAALESYVEYTLAYGALGRGKLVEGKVDPETGQPIYTWRRPSLGGFRRDPDYFNVLAVEHFDQETGNASPAPILLRRVNHAPERATSAASVAEAVAISRGESQRIDLGRVAELLDLSEADVLGQLDGEVFTDPATGQLVARGEYLSGDIRSKLEHARLSGSDFGANVTALEEALPEQLGPLDIRPQLGAPWITVPMVRDFAREVFGLSGRITRDEHAAIWDVEFSGFCPPEARAQFGTPDMDPMKLLGHALNSRTPTVYDEDWSRGRKTRTKNTTKTLAAEEMLKSIQLRFSTWLWEDEERAAVVCDEYNRRFRSHRPRRGDGAYLTFPGLSTSIDLWSHQRDAVDRIINTDRIILNHAVGAGKTLEAIVGAVKLRQLGLANKPLIVVPNHLLEQIARQARQAYPTGRFLIAGSEEMEKSARRLFAARCATGEWDAVVMTHGAFASIGVDPEAETAWIEEQKAELRTQLSDLKSNDDDTKDAYRGAKRIASAVRKLEAQIEKLRQRASDPSLVTFDQLGVDHISVDELHLFRRLMVNSNSRSEFSLGHSKRALDLHLKVTLLAERRPGMPVFAGFTGTLLSNTLAEVYIWQLFTQPDRLAEAGVLNFDAWASSFVRFDTVVEVKPEGSGFHLKRRPGSILNAPELAAMLAENCDTVTAESINLERPDFEVVNIASEASDEQKSMVAELAERAEKIRAGGVDPKQDNMLAVCNQGRLLALDPALLGGGISPSLIDSADKIAEVWRENRTRAFPGSEITGVFQLVLCDLGTPNESDSRTYGRLRRMLADRGVPLAAVRFIHEATTDKARAALFAQCRSGEVAVLIGSTAKVGFGTNIQTRLRAIHHLDAPWLPSDIEQRDGRGLRPNNRCEFVSIYRYVTTGTFDALMWETLQRKARFIAQFASASIGQREIEDVADQVLSFGQIKAMAAGRPELLRHAEVQAQARTISLMRSVWLQQVNGERRVADRCAREIDSLNYERKFLGEVMDHYRPDGVCTQGVILNDLLKPGPTYLYNAAYGSWRGIQIRAKREDGQRMFTATISYHQVHEAEIPKAVIRRGEVAVARFIDRVMTEWIEGLDELQAKFVERQTALREQAAKSLAFVESATFPREAELADVEAELARLEAAMAELATPEAAPLAA